MEEKFSDTAQQIGSAIEGELLTARRQFQVRWLEVIITSLFVAGGIVLFCLGLTDLLTLSIIVFGSLWNFFTESNKLFACIMAFFMCVVYGFVCGSMLVYGHAFLHLMFYLPTQLIYYYESQKNEDNNISHTKKLTTAGYIGTVVAGWVFAFGLGAVLCKLGDPYYIIDALSTTLLVVSVFLVNGRYKEYYVVRIVACVCAAIMWLTIAVAQDFTNGTLIFMMLFIMYSIVDSVKFYRWSKQAK